MQVSVEEVSNIERRLTIVVPADQVNAAYEKQITELGKKANIKGFRPGKAPMSYIVDRFGADARKEAYSEIMQDALYRAITEKNLNPVSAPRIEPKTTQMDQPFEFVATFEVLPELKSVEFSMDKLEKLNVDVTAEDVGRVVEQLCKQYTKWNIVDRPAKLKDRVVIDYYAIYDGKSEIDNKVENYPVELGSKTMLPGFEDALVGCKVGEEHKITSTFPADFQMEDRAGKQIEFVVNVKQIFEAEMPEMNDAFIKGLGVKSGNLEELQKQIKDSLELERDRLVREKMKEQVFRQLLEMNPIEVPKALIEREAQSIHDEIHPGHSHHDHSADEMATFNDIAKKRVSLGLLIAEYAKKANLRPETARVLARIQEIAAAYENPQEVITYLSAEERKSGIEAQVMEDQVMDSLIKDIPVVEKTMSYAELKGIRI